jgi:hypothetical protein
MYGRDTHAVALLLSFLEGDRRSTIYGPPVRWNWKVVVNRNAVLASLLHAKYET